MPPSLSHLPLEKTTEEHYVHIISDLLSPPECDALISSHGSSDALIPISGRYTTRLREIFEDEDLARLLWDRLRPFYADTVVADEQGASWKAFGLNRHFRFCKYRPGDAFSPHHDSRLLSSVTTQSFLTVNIYLNTIPPSSGGATRFLDEHRPNPNPDPAGPTPYHVLAQNHPVAGAAAVFRDTVFHDGEPLRQGVKYLLRTDLMFRRQGEFDFEKMYGALGAEERAKRAWELAGRLEDGGNREEAVCWYRRAVRLDPGVERGA